MARGSEIPYDVRRLIVQWVEEGQSYAEIGRRIKRDESTVRNFYKKYLATGQITSAPRPGRPPKLSEKGRRVSYRRWLKALESL